MTEKEFLRAVDLLYSKYLQSEGAVGFGSFSDRLSWLVIEYKEGIDSKVANWWKKDFD